MARRSLLLISLSAAIIAACQIAPETTPTTVATKFPQATPTSQAAAMPTETATVAPSATATPEPLPPTATTPSSTPTATAAGPTPLPTVASGETGVLPPPAEDGLLSQALRPEQQADLPRLATLSHYRVGAELDLEQGVITGSEVISFTNREGSALSELVLRLFPNVAYSMAEGPTTVDRMRVGQVLVDGAAVDLHYLAENTAIALRLSGPLPPGETVEISLAFSTQIDVEPNDYGHWSIAPFYPLLAVYDETGWRLDRPPAGDVIYGDSANHEVRVKAPVDLAFVASGSVVASEDSEDETVTYTVSGPGMRHMVLALGDFTLRQEMVDGVAVKLWHRPDEPFVEERVTAAVEAMRFFNRRFGPYPYLELDIVNRYRPAVGGGGGGLEYPGFVYAVYGQTPGLHGLVHEIAHQWWYGVVGNDTHLEPWLDEATANVSSLLFVRETAGEEAAQELLTAEILHGESFEAGQVAVGQSVYDFADVLTYLDSVYGGGALFLEELRQTVGDDAFFAFLQAYYQQNKYRVATAAGFQALAESTTGRELDDLFDRWLR